MTHWEVLRCPHCGCVLAQATEGYTLDHPTAVECLGDLLAAMAVQEKSTKGNGIARIAKKHQASRNANVC